MKCVQTTETTDVVLIGAACCSDAAALRVSLLNRPAFACGDGCSLHSTDEETEVQSDEVASE